MDDPGKHINFRNIFGGVGVFFDILTEIAEAGRDEYVCKGEIGDRKLKGMYDFSVKLGVLEKDLDGLVPQRKLLLEESPEPFQNGCTLLDLFDEGEFYHIITEIADADPEKLVFELKEDGELVIQSCKEDEALRRVKLPDAVDEKTLEWRVRNYILDVRIWKK